MEAGNSVNNNYHTMIRFDTATLKKWEENNIHDITCKIVSGGCAGKKMEVLEYDDTKSEVLITQG